MFSARNQNLSEPAASYVPQRRRVILIPCKQSGEPSFRLFFERNNSFVMFYYTIPPHLQSIGEQGPHSYPNKARIPFLRLPRERVGRRRSSVYLALAGGGACPSRDRSWSGCSGMQWAWSSIQCNSVHLALAGCTTARRPGWHAPFSLF